jgi:hypothetical protein
MPRRSTPPDIRRIASWELSDGSMVYVQVHRVTVEQWRATSLYQDGTWHVVPDAEGHLLLMRLRHEPARGHWR